MITMIQCINDDLIGWCQCIAEDDNRWQLPLLPLDFKHSTINKSISQLVMMETNILCKHAYMRHPRVLFRYFMFSFIVVGNI
jgi:hypothetical protein